MSSNCRVRFFVFYKRKTDKHIYDSSVQNERNHIRVRLKYKWEVKKIADVIQNVTENENFSRI